MRAAIIYHSETGRTRAVAEATAARCGADCIRVYPRPAYTALTRFLFGPRRAVLGHHDRISPAPIDVSAYDTIVIGSPVWAGHPTPPVVSAVGSLQGCRGKEAVLFVTCCVTPGIALERMSAMAEGMGMTVRGGMAFPGRSVHDPLQLDALAALVAKKPEE
ncbi:MAG: ArsR family transcriptional regulator [Methanomicrobiaceae archaeon]|nr:ArsR family transcriptional regulator [Methanomicrobiaceae archaeon]